MAATAQLALPVRDFVLDEAEACLLDLMGVLLGDRRKGRGPKNDMGLMSHVVEGTRHLERCQYGMRITPGLGPRGDPCGARCRRAHAAIDRAEAFLMAREREER